MISIRSVVILFFLLLNRFNVFSQEAIFYGARNESLARATVALEDSWALFYNPAGLSKKTEILVGYQNKYTSFGINDGAFGFIFPIKKTAVGIGASYFGDELLNKIKLVGSAAHSIGKTSLGLKVVYDQIKVDEIGSKGIVYLNIGGQIRINEQIVVGMVINNISQTKFDKLFLSEPDTKVMVGINYSPHKKLILLVQVEKDILNPVMFRLALEYAISKNVFVRTGVLPLPTSAFAGVGFDWNKIKLDLVGSYQQSLGWSGGLSIGIPLFISDE